MIKGLRETATACASLPWGNVHRSLKIRKIENGTVISAKFLQNLQFRNLSGEVTGTREDWVEREFAFVQEEDMLNFVREYFQEPAEGLKNGDDQ